MLAGIFAVVQLLLKAIGLWEQFLNMVDRQKIADAEKRNQERGKAVDQQKGAKSEEEFDNAQDKIVDNSPGH